MYEKGTLNACNEFIEHTEDKPAIKCAIIEFAGKKRKLRCGYNMRLYEAFLLRISFQYDAGYGSQNLYGTIWYIDGTYSERSEYNGSERWEYRKAPEVPKELQKRTSPQ